MSTVELRNDGMYFPIKEISKTIGRDIVTNKWSYAIRKMDDEHSCRIQFYKGTSRCIIRSSVLRIPKHKLINASGFNIDDNTTFIFDRSEKSCIDVLFYKDYCDKVQAELDKQAEEIKQQFKNAAYNMCFLKPELSFNYTGTKRKHLHIDVLGANPKSNEEVIETINNIRDDIIKSTEARFPFKSLYKLNENLDHNQIINELVKNYKWMVKGSNLVPSYSRKELFNKIMSLKSKNVINLHDVMDYDNKISTNREMALDLLKNMEKERYIDKIGHSMWRFVPKHKLTYDHDISFSF